MSESDINHEMIHTAQMKDMGYVFFYIWYLVEWLVKLVKLGDSNKAYRAISFEREAYGNEKNLTYTITREKFAWRKLI